VRSTHSAATIHPSPAGAVCPCLLSLGSGPASRASEPACAAAAVLLVWRLLAVGCVAALFATVAAWVCLSGHQRPHALEGPQLAAFRAATATSSASDASAAVDNDDAGSGARERAPTAGTACPICLNDVAMAAQANCGHWYCGGCIISYWRHSSRGGGQLRCPCCRRGITLMHSALTQAGAI
jgi:hypothetical protein